MQATRLSHVPREHLDCEPLQPTKRRLTVGVEAGNNGRRTRTAQRLRAQQLYGANRVIIESTLRFGMRRPCALSC
ncbi:MAG: hypothetical protein KDA20_10560 [Phycisphaerales bacterium]|nr:hypothetical protein [Phycisphaerales bacterium]